MRAGSPMASSASSARLGAPPCSGPAERAEGGAADVREIGAGGGHDASREGRRVEPVIDRQDEVPLERAGRGGCRDLTGHEAEVVGGVAQVGRRRDRRETEARPVQRGDDRRHDGGDTQALSGALVGRDVDQRAEAELVSGDRDRGPHPAERGTAGLRQRFEHGQHRLRKVPRGRNRVAEVGGLHQVRQVADRHEVPHLLEGAGAGQGRRVVPAVVVVAGLTVDVADRGVGHSHAVQARGYIDQDGHGFIFGAWTDAINVDPINID